MSQLKKIDANIRGIAKRGKAMRLSVQATAVLIVEHAKESNDCSRALNLVAAIPMASERVKLIQWFGLVSPINVTFTADVAKRRVGLRKSDAKGYNAFNVERAKVLEYWTVGKDDDAETEALTTAAVNTLIQKLAKSLRKKLDDGKVAANDIANVTAKVTALEKALTKKAA